MTKRPPQRPAGALHLKYSEAQATEDEGYLNGLVEPIILLASGAGLGPWTPAETHRSRRSSSSSVSRRWMSVAAPFSTQTTAGRRAAL